MRFSNPLQLAAQKAITGGHWLIYRVGNYQFLACEMPCWDSEAIIECMIHRVYDRAFEASRPREGVGTYINLGAHVGAFDAAVHRAWNGRAQGVSVEMNPWTHARLTHNLYWNRLPAKPLCAAVTAAAAVSVPVNPLDSHTGQSLLSNQDVSGSVLVPAIPLNRIPDPVPGRPIDLLKVDIEGSEIAVFGQASAEDLKRFRHIVMELHQSGFDFDRQQFLEGIAQKGSYAFKAMPTPKGELIFFYPHKA